MTRFFLLTLFLVFSFIPSIAQAACSSPAGEAGEQIYNADYKTMQFCDGTNWISMKGGNISGGSQIDGGCTGVSAIPWGVATDCSNICNIDLFNGAIAGVCPSGYSTVIVGAPREMCNTSAYGSLQGAGCYCGGGVGGSNNTYFRAPTLCIKD